MRGSAVPARYLEAYSSSAWVYCYIPVGGGLITLEFLGALWDWAQLRPGLSSAARTGADFGMTLGSVFTFYSHRVTLQVKSQL